MPTYDYECASCSHVFEVFHSIQEKPRPKCPECQQRGCRRLMGSGTGLIFKGSGFYITDYQKESGKGQEKDVASSTSSQEASKAENKPTETKESKKDSKE